VRAAIESANADQAVFGVMTMEELIADSVTEPRFHVFLIGAFAVYEAVETRKKLAGKAQEMLESGNMTCKEARMFILDTVKRYGNPGEIPGYLRCEMDERR